MQGPGPVAMAKRVSMARPAKLVPAGDCEGRVQNVSKRWRGRRNTSVMILALELARGLSCLRPGPAQVVEGDGLSGRRKAHMEKSSGDDTPIGGVHANVRSGDPVSTIWNNSKPGSDVWSMDDILASVPGSVDCRIEVRQLDSWRHRWCCARRCHGVQSDVSVVWPLDSHIGWCEAAQSDLTEEG